MKTYNIRVVVEYEYEFECDTPEEAEAEAWNYEDYAYSATVDSFEVEDITPEDEDE